MRLPLPSVPRIPTRLFRLGLVASCAAVGTLTYASTAPVHTTEHVARTCPGQNFTLNPTGTTALPAGATLRTFTVRPAGSRSNVRIAAVTARLDKDLELVPLVDNVIERRSTRARVSAPGTVAGINGDFFDMSPRGEVIRHVVRDGQFLKGDRRSRVMVGVDTNGRMHASKMHMAGSVTLHRPVTVTDHKTGKSRRVLRPIARTGLQGLNTLKAGGITVYNPLAGRLRRKHRTFEVTVRNHRIVETRESAVPLRIRPGTRVLAANRGTPGAMLLRRARIGDRLDWTTRQVSDNRTPFVHAIGAGGRIAHNGRNVADCSDIYNKYEFPRTGLGWSADGKTVTFITAAHPSGWYAGLTTAGMSKVFLNLGVPNAVLVDGGGSTTLDVRTDMNRPPQRVDSLTGWGERPVPNGLGLRIPRQFR